MDETPSLEAGDPAGSVATARAEFHCPACGAEAHWNPGKQELVCPFCGTRSPGTLETHAGGQTIVEHGLAEALRSIPDSARGWQATKTSVRCQSCQAISVFDPEKVGRNCEFCGSSSLVPYEQVKDAFRPESLLPLKISEPQARDLIRAWYGRQWFAPNAFRLKAMTDTVRALYLPYWTFDAKADATWTAEAGDYYYVQQGKQRVRRVRWYPASGAVSRAFDDELVCASMGVSASMMRAIEPFPTGEVVPYDPGYLAGWTVERYQIDLIAAAERSRQQMESEVRAMCEADVPGDTHRNLEVNTRYSDQTFKHILAPVWLLTYLFRGRAYHVVVNGVTGRIAGTRPWSWIKIGLLVLAALAVAAVIAASQQ